MTLEIVSILCLLAIIGISIYLTVTYVTLREDVKAIKAAIPPAAEVKAAEAASTTTTAATPSKALIAKAKLKEGTAVEYQSVVDTKRETLTEEQFNTNYKDEAKRANLVIGWKNDNGLYEYIYAVDRLKGITLQPFDVKKVSTIQSVQRNVDGIRYATLPGPVYMTVADSFEWKK